MKNVIVFTIREVGYAVELRWIREVFTFGHVSPVPHAPRSVAGVVNFRGSILTIIDLREAPDTARQGESGLLLEVDRHRAALRAGTINEVSSLSEADTEGFLLDGSNREVKLLWPPTLFAGVKSNGHLPVETT